MNELTEMTHSPTQPYGQSLPPQRRSKHRAWIGVKVEAVLHGYFKERPSDAVWAEIQRGWMEQLEAFTEDEIRAAFTAYVRDNPRKRPNEGAIRQLCEGQRKIAIAKHRTAHPEPAPEPRANPTPEAKARVAAMAAEVARSNRVGGAA